jgi:hypothetical protein
LTQDAPQDVVPATHETVRHQMAVAMKANLVPGLIIWTIGLAIVLGYYFVAPMTNAMNVFKDKIDNDWGLWYSILATPIFGAVLPFAMQFLSKDPSGRQPAKALPFLMLFWAYRGTEIGLLYGFQAKLWGHLPPALEVGISAFIDQFIFVPFWAVWTMVGAYYWKDHGYSFKRMHAAMEDIREVRQREFGGPRRSLFGAWYREKAWPIVVTNWFIWVPSVILIYSLPAALRLPLMQLILCLFVLVITIIMHHKPEAKQ